MWLVNTIWYYGTPSTLDDLLQESSWAGCSGDQAKSIFLKPADPPLHKDLLIASVPLLDITFSSIEVITTLQFT